MAQIPATQPVAVRNRESPEGAVREKTIEIKPPDAGANQAHLLFVDGLRALAALFVVWHHSWLEVWTPVYQRTPPGLTGKLTQWLLYGHFAVALFIVLSGYSLMLSVVRGNGYLRGGAKTFFARRARRILPPYYFALLLCLALIFTLIGQKTGTHWDASVHVTKHGLLDRLLLLQDIRGGAEINHVFWSISVEWHYYLLFPLLVLGWRKIGGWLTTLAAFAVSYVGMKTVHSENIHEALFPFLTLFALGMLGATICFDKTGKWPAVRDRVPWLALAAVFGPFTFRLLSTRFYWTADFVFGVACLALLVGAARSPQNPLTRFLSSRPLVFLGGFSYSLYLVHAPLIQLLWQYGLRPLHLGDTVTFLALIVVGTPLFIGGAYLFYWFCERPFLTTAKRKVA